MSKRTNLLVSLAAVALVACGSASSSDGAGGPEAPTTPPPDDGFVRSPPGPHDTSCAAATLKADGQPVDIIFVIDTSASMSEELAEVRRNVNTFAESIGSHGLDYRVIAITTRGRGNGFDTLALCVPQPLAGSNCDDNDPIFHQVDVDVGSYDSLDVLLSTYDGTIDPFDNHGSSTTTAWKNFLRMDAYKIFIAITDDDSHTPAATFDQRLLQKQPAGMFGTAAKRKYIFNSIVGWQEGTALLSTSHCSSATAAGVDYQRLSQLTGGVVQSVCKTDYSGVLDQVTKGVSGRLGCDFGLPRPGTGGTVDPHQVVVRFTPGAGFPRPLTQVTDVAKCVQNPDAWYYDDAAKPTRIVLCEATCGTVASDPAAKIDIQVGCTAPPPK